MGLDMYLTKRVFIGANYEHRNVKGTIELTEGKENKPIQINFKRFNSIIESVGYWRQANQVHQWFVDNVQGGKDDCKEYYVDVEKLKELVSACREDIEYLKSLDSYDSEPYNDFFTGKSITYKIFTDVDDNKMNLSPQEGFFFGNTEINEYYLNDLEETINMLEPLIENESDSDFYYESSWEKIINKQ